MTSRVECHPLPPAGSSSSLREPTARGALHVVCIWLVTAHARACTVASELSPGWGQPWPASLSQPRGCAEHLQLPLRGPGLRARPVLRFLCPSSHKHVPKPFLHDPPCPGWVSHPTSWFEKVNESPFSAWQSPQHLPGTLGFSATSRASCGQPHTHLPLSCLSLLRWHPGMPAALQRNPANRSCECQVSGLTSTLCLALPAASVWGALEGRTQRAGLWVCPRQLNVRAE